MAKTLNDDELIHLLSSGDVVSNELFYHKEEVKCCLAKYHKLYKMYFQHKKEMGDSSVNKFEDEWWEITSFNKLKYYMFSKEKELEQLYIEMLKNLGIKKEFHVTRFSSRLCQEIDGILWGQRLLL